MLSDQYFGILCQSSGRSFKSVVTRNCRPILKLKKFLEAEESNFQVSSQQQNLKNLVGQLRLRETKNVKSWLLSSNKGLSTVC